MPRVKLTQMSMGRVTHVNTRMDNMNESRHLYESCE